MYDMQYFAARNQDRDRPALWFYERIIRRWIRSGPVLDYGCGTGYLLRRLARYYEVFGYDISPNARDATRSTVPGMVAYAEQDHFPQEFFGGIVSLHVLEHIEYSELPATLDYWRRSLVAQGRVLCAVPDADGLGHALSGNGWIGFGDPTHVTLMGWVGWRDLFAASGFSVHRVGTDGLWNLPYRKGSGKMIDGLRFSVPTVIQYLAGRLLLPPGSGESAVFLLEKM